MSEKLKPCPFCNGGATDVREHSLPPRMDGQPSAIISVEIRHWCSPLPGLVACSTVFRGRDKESAIEAWNRRHQDQSNPSEFERMLSK